MLNLLDTARENLINVGSGLYASYGLGLLPLLLFLAFHLLRYVCHYALILLDKIHRHNCQKFHSKWKFESVSHTRATMARKPDHDLSGWELVEDEGRQRWFYRGASHAKKQSFIEKYHLGLVPKESASDQGSRKTLKEAIEDGSDFLCKLQSPDGHWSNDYSGPLFLTPGAVITKFIVFDGRKEMMFPSPQAMTETLRYIVNIQNPDGGFGVHTEGHSTMMGTSLNYVAMRLLGEPANSKPATAAREWIRSRGGAVSAPAWAKVWLAVAGLYSWDGVDPVPAEMWLLPDWMPLSMGRTWCHARAVSCPFGYLYSTRFVARDCSLLQQLRQEMYLEDFNTINWASHRSNVFADDVYLPKSIFFQFANQVLRCYEALPWKPLRKWALDISLDHCRYDDKVTNFICLGPVNKSLNLLITWITEGRSPNFERHVERWDDYFFMGPEGMRMSGYNGSQLWDTSFAAQALIAADQQKRKTTELQMAHGYVDVAQVRDDPPQREKYYHNRTKGCWNFSTRAQQWQVSDCTAEGLRITVLLRNDPVAAPKAPFEVQRIFDGVDELLHLRNWDSDGGWASYEPSRSYSYVELLNCADVFKDIMIDYSYTECSSSCIHTLSLFRKQFPQYRARDIDVAIREAVKVVKGKQRPDGSWYGSWAVCFTYAAWLATEGLHLAGEPANSPTFQKCAEFLLSKQNEDGGWGEDINACVTGHWVDSPDGSSVVMTSWAVMALLVAGGHGERHMTDITRGVQFLIDKQLPSGDWNQERIVGVFNGNCAIHYPGYKNQMPVWALGKYNATLQRIGKTMSDIASPMVLASNGVASPRRSRRMASEEEKTTRSASKPKKK